MKHFLLKNHCLNLLPHHDIAYQALLKSTVYYSLMNHRPRILRIGNWYDNRDAIANEKSDIMWINFGFSI